MKVSIRKRETAPAVEAPACTDRGSARLRLWGESFCVAFSLYSAIPMPRVTWTKENMKYAFCFFPLVGAAIGAALYLWLSLCLLLGQPLVFAAGAAALPILLTGGIHMDGFCDTLDALGSHGGTEKRLEIMKDSRAGAFAVMGCVLCLLMSFALWTAFYRHPTGAVFFIFLLSRSLSGLGVMRFRCAKGSGLAASFADAAEKRAVAAVLVAYAAASAVCMALFSIFGAILCAVSVCCLLLYYREKAYRLFGGITGDLAGWFLVLCELLQLAILTFAGQCA